MADSAPFYLSEEGDTVDRIVWKHYGRQSSGVVEAILASNPNVAGLGPLLPLGTRVELPVVVDAPADESVRLWG
jgi:phage tail protein X